MNTAVKINGQKGTESRCPDRGKKGVIGSKAITGIGETTPFMSMKSLEKPIGVMGIGVKATLPLYSLAISEGYNWGNGVP
jgi:hypothetical protein